VGADSVILSVSVTERGRALADRLPYAHVHGQAGDTIRQRWSDVEGFVLFLATGAAVRIIAPLLEDKRTDPAVVCIDEAGRFAIALTGGHEGGGNQLAREVADLIGAEPVITTASDADPAPLTPTLAVGIGTSTNAPASDVVTLLNEALAVAGLDRDAIAEVATIDRRINEPAIVTLGYPVRVFSAEELAAVEVPNPSDVVRNAVGTPSVCEAAALLAAGRDAELVVTKRSNATATVAIARRSHPRGKLSIVGLGPGIAAHRTPAAERAVREADVVIGYGPYIDQCAALISHHQEVVRSPIGDELVRAKQALADAELGRTVALVCSGDAGVYAMASVTLELAPSSQHFDIEVVPGVTAALAAAAALGAPLGHDHVAISLSDLLTPWTAIEKRLHAAAEADLVVALYNPRSRGRAWQLDAARTILLERRRPDTPVGVVTDVGRAGQTVTLTTLADLDVELVGMTTCVIIGSSTTRIVASRMVTPRGYQS
jgi:cobalt-precorrin 5A hydrolase / precorrin-3B C17-methyltransferase